MVLVHPTWWNIWNRMHRLSIKGSFLGKRTGGSMMKVVRVSLEHQICRKCLLSKISSFWQDILPLDLYREDKKYIKTLATCLWVPSDIYSIVPKRCQRKIEELRVRAWTLGHKSRVLQMHQMQILSIWHKQYIFVHSEFAFNFPFYFCRFLRNVMLNFLYLKGIYL